MIPDPELAAIRKRFEDAPHESGCGLERCAECNRNRNSIYHDTYLNKFTHGFVPKSCNCWKSTFGLDALLGRLAAAENQVMKLACTLEGARQDSDLLDWWDERLLDRR